MIRESGWGCDEEEEVVVVEGATEGVRVERRAVSVGERRVVEIVSGVGIAEAEMGGSVGSGRGGWSREDQVWRSDWRL